MENNIDIITEITHKIDEYRNRIMPLMLKRNIINRHISIDDIEKEYPSLYEKMKDVYHQEIDTHTIENELIVFLDNFNKMMDELKYDYKNDTINSCVNTIILTLKTTISSFEFERIQKKSDERYAHLKQLLNDDEKIFNEVIKNSDSNKLFELIKNNIPKIRTLVTQGKAVYAFDNINQKVFIDTYYIADGKFVHDIVVKFIDNSFTLLEKMMNESLILDEKYDFLCKLHKNYIDLEKNNNFDASDLFEKNLDDIINICTVSNELFGWFKHN